jgi:hypothetical protein
MSELEAAPAIVSEEELDAFMEGKDEESAPPEEEAPESVEEKEEEPEPEEETEVEESEPEIEEPKTEGSKKPGGVQKKISKLTRRVHERDAEIEQLRQEKEELLRKVVPVDPEPKEDDPDIDYDPDKLDAARRAWDRRQIVRELRQDIYVDPREQAEAEAEAAFKKKVADADIEDYEEKRDELVFSFPESNPMPLKMLRAIQFTKDPKVVTYLAENLTQAHKIATMLPEAMAVELGRISAKMSLPLSKRITKAPNPMKPLGSGGRLKKEASKMSMDEIMADDNI